MELTYSKYLQLDELLNLQEPQSKPPEHDEMLFIIIHQAYELWFKQVMHEFGRVEECFARDDLFGAIHTFKRLRSVMKLLVAQMDVLETMTPMSFTSFRDRLDTASGFQSVQYRELEFLLGYKRADMLRYHPEPVQRKLEERLNAPAFYDHFYRFLVKRGVEVPQALLERDVTAPIEGDPQVQRGLLELYRSSPELGILLELMTDFDEGLMEWRYRHVMLVKRTIGSKHGTGGSLGVEFLKKSLFKPSFPDLWDIRHEL